MQHNEIIWVRGDVVVTMIPVAGGEAIRKEYKNLVVSSGKTILAKLLAHDASYVGEYISKIGFGTGNTAAAIGDTGLKALVLSKAVTITYPAFNQVMFSATMNDNEGGSSTYQEIGLLSSGTSKLFSRLVISPITKSTLYKIQVDWTISFQ